MKRSTYKQTDKCSRKYDHDWKSLEPVETKHYIIRECSKCHGKLYKARRD